MFTAWAYSSVG